MKRGQKAKLEKSREVVRKEDQGTRREKKEQPGPQRRPGYPVEKSIPKRDSPAYERPPGSSTPIPPKKKKDGS